MRFLSVSWQVSANGEYSSDISVGKSELRILEKFRVNSWLNFLAEVYFICWREYAEDCLSTTNANPLFGLYRVGSESTAPCSCHEEEND